MSLAAPSGGALDPGQRERLCAAVRRLTGIEMPEGRRADLERSVAQGQASTGAADADELIAMLDSPSRAQPALRAMLPALTVGETHFFRNRPQMEALAQEVLPAIIARRRSERRLRIWSAGCATGEEPYSVAMLIDGLLADRRHWDVRIVGTDLNPEALERARLGVYGSWSFREVPEPMKRTHFAPSASGKLELSPQIREMVTFAPLNLVTADYGAPPLALTDLDLILCRNVLIYFRPEVVRDVVRRLEAALVPGGWLVVGHVEPSQDVFGTLETVNRPGTVLYRRSGPPVSARPEPADRPARRRPVPGASGRADRADRAPARPPDPRGGDAYDEARRLAGRLRWSEALECGERAVRAAPMQAPAHLLLGHVLRELGRDDEALGAYRRCLYLDPDLAVGHLALADALLRRGQTTRAARELEVAGRQAAAHRPGDAVPEGDGLTWGRLAELVAARSRLAD